MSGSFLLVLHGHMPWVLHHGRWPHGEHWLYEAALDVYLPLLGMLDELEGYGVVAPFCLGLTPVLLEQLASPRFAKGFPLYLAERQARAAADRRNPEFAELAAWWEAGLAAKAERYRELEGDLIGAFVAHHQAGRVELLTSFATHGYAPLLLQDQSIRGQLRTGLQISERHLGFRPEGIWLPECGFRPAGSWTPPVLHGDARSRRGVDQILADEGITHFFVDAHIIGGARSEGVITGGAVHRVGWEHADGDAGRGWRNPLEPHRINTEGGTGGPVAFGRHPQLSEQVWSADVGYPGEGRYLEFHKRKDTDGLRYWAVTDRKAELHHKQRYEPYGLEAVVHRQAVHFAHTVRDRLRQWKADTGRDGVACAPFDAELFGHWWHEGPDFLRDVLLTLHHDPEVAVTGAAALLERQPPDKLAWIPEGSWGEGGDHRVWLNDQSRWTWEAAYRAEDRFLGLLAEARSAPDGLGTLRAWELLHKAARELLLLQASDWNFVIQTGGAVDYGFRRFCDHLGRFDQLCTLTADVLAGREPEDWELLGEELADALVPAFPLPPLDAWG